MSRRGLGRGLGALIPTGPREDTSPEDGATIDLSGASSGTDPGTEPGRSPETTPPDAATAGEPLLPVRGARFAELPVGAITPNPQQPRTVFDEEAMAELVASIREVGLLQPVVVRPLGADRYELVMGERRWRATQEAGLATIPAIVRETQDAAMLRDALLENLHRSQLNPLEEAAAYDQLLKDFGCTQEELAQRVGRSRPTVTNTLRLLRLPAPVQRRVAAGVLSAGHARALLALDDPGAQDRLAHRIVAEGLSVRAVEEIVALGEEPTTPPTRVAHRSAPTAPGLTELADRLSDHLETRVRIQMGRSRGKVVIDFATLDDLHRIVAALEQDAASPH